MNIQTIAVEELDEGLCHAKEIESHLEACGSCVEGLQMSKPYKQNNVSTGKR